MAETTIGGSGGNVTMAGFNNKIQAWEATISGPQADITSFSSHDWIEVYPHGVVGCAARVIGTGLSAAQTTIQGSGGTCTIAGFVCKFDTWSINCGVTLANTTGFIDAGWQVMEPMLGTVSGTAIGTVIEESCPFDATIFANPALTANFLSATVLELTPAINFSGTALVTNVKLSRTIMGKMVGQVDFIYTGKVTPTWGTVPPFPTAMMTGTDFAPAQALATLTLTAATGKTISGPFVMSNCAISRTENGKVDVVYDFVSRGALTAAW